MIKTESNHPATAKTEFQLSPLPYAQDALAPHVSAKTMSFHYGKHHQAYVDNLNKLVAGTSWVGQPLEKIIRETSGTVDKAAIFNNAAQVWNHTFFWRSMTPQKGEAPEGRMAQLLEPLGGIDGFKEKFVGAAEGRFGSGYVWLLVRDGRPEIVDTPNAEIPFTGSGNPILACDVWEHAYYLDYQNQRAKFVEAFVDHLIDWRKVAERLDSEPARALRKAA
jgi:Fe-Mn family superoxide dismutase